MVGKLWREIAGSVLVEYSVAFPAFILITLGGVDVTYMLADWALANKAAYVGARYAVVSYPVAYKGLDPDGNKISITQPSYSVAQLQNLGVLCADSATGDPKSPTLCPLSSSSCTGAGGGSCSGGLSYDSVAFTNILRRMQAVFCPQKASPYTNCPLQAQNVRVSYNNIPSLGFVGQPDPGGIPTTVTVSVTGLVHQFYFIGPIMGFFGGGFSNKQIPQFATTLTSEDMTTN